jgi:hypothetical protein
MSDYTKTTDFAAKDALASGNANKVIKGTEFDDEFNALETAIASKYDSTDRNTANGIAGLDASALVEPTYLPTATTTAAGVLEVATELEAEAATATDKILTPSTLNLNTGVLADLLNLAAPGGDRLYFYDSSGTAATKYLQIDATLDITGTTLSVGTLVNANVPESAVTQHQAALSITESQISDLGAYIESGDTVASLTITNGTVTTLGSTTATITSLELGSTASTLTQNGTNTDQIDVEGDTIFSHESASYNSAKIHISDVAPTTEGDNGDLWFEY